MVAKCPKSPRHKKFVTTAHEVHDWVVDENGEFLKDLGCLEVAHKPDQGNIWICQTCGSQAVFTTEEA